MSSESAACAAGTLYVVSAPSGAGKTTLCRGLLQQFPDLSLSVSYTSRPPRPGERDGHDYHFVSVACFERMIDEGAFVEWARVHDNYYGTSLAVLRQATAAGQDLLLEIDVQGAEQLRLAGLPLVSIFIAPPSLAELRRRLEGRASDSATVVALRLENARAEMAAAERYDYLIVNDTLAQAQLQLQAIVLAQRCRSPRVLAQWRKRWLQE
ncbi:MAG: guanylate kinase [Desulfuromonas thiophila]|jgi:guanylate kinase|nr:guanylate kinase [Desulfuromonas thiophila]